MPTVTRRERLRYWFDGTMAKGTPALVGWLAVVLVTMVLFFGLGTWALVPRTGELADAGFFKTLWLTFVRIMDPGAIGSDDTSNVAFVGMMLLATLGGILVFSALVGVIATGLDNKLVELRKGRSRVIERDHTILLGWSEQVFIMLSELIEANESEKRAAVAILADKDKVEMEDEIRERISDTKSTKVICRTGNLLNPYDLEIANPDEARSIIVVPANGEESDNEVIKTLLALSHRSERRGQSYNVVATVNDSLSMGAARLAGGSGTYIVDADDVTSRLVVQTALQSGLSAIYTDLFDFGGDEMYLTEEPRLVGASFGQSLFAYETSSVLGMRLANGRTVLNPPPDTRIAEGDQLIVIAEDDSAIRLGSRPPGINEEAILRPQPRTPTPIRVLVMGWNERAALIVEQLDSYLAPESAIHIAARQPTAQDELDKVKPNLKNTSVMLADADITERGFLERVDFSMYEHVIVLTYNHIELQAADSQTLVTLLHLRDLARRRGEDYSVVSEMRDDHNRELAQATQADDFIVSGKLISLLMTQLSENPHLNPVFTNLLDPEGSEIYLKPVVDYVRPDMRTDFYTVVESARRQGQIAIGYRIQARSTEPDAGIVLNPDKREHVRFTPDDKVIVLAED
ncbi:Trk K+ transport system NAD-binding subunit [Lipingzhangella halophila]|uniref:Trk K+ transport system NAD-binding subunit n=1 Tax=Lipingzhangella halophila TaxID=1783352 RepID=A0A7W7W0T6_9ACTN|nr:potassium transporter TrkA [Lipingzhangella halophila]MBB4929593.1 Trk K+ transport system NAD-binding subunit [Lipingzhangella halophila]